MQGLIDTGTTEQNDSRQKTDQDPAYAAGIIPGDNRFPENGIFILTHGVTVCLDARDGWPYGLR